MNKSRQEVDFPVESYHGQSEVLKRIFLKKEKERTHPGLISVNARVTVCVSSAGLVALSVGNPL